MVLKWFIKQSGKHDVIHESNEAMETTENNNPKDENITNDDNSVTNTDHADEVNKHPEPEAEVAKEIPTVTPNNEGDPTSIQPEDDSSNKDKGPAGENL